jgi:Major Facilitator Superfamily.
MTTTIAPVLGPILGGYLCDEYSWHWVFFLNTPIAIGCAFIGWNLLQRYTDPLSKTRSTGLVSSCSLSGWLPCN